MALGEHKSARTITAAGRSLAGYIRFVSRTSRTLHEPPDLAQLADQQHDKQHKDCRQAGAGPGEMLVVADDFGAFGQLTCLALFDPTPSAICVEQTPRVYAWVEATEDLSGHPGDTAAWIARADVPGSLRALLAEVGRVYAPYLVANAQAIASGSEALDTTIDGKRWTQKPFPYQAKCLAALRAQYHALAAGDRSAVDAILAGTGCEPLFTS